MELNLTIGEAREFFGELYYGEHHFPSQLKEFGYGWRMDHYGDLSTFDFNVLTRLVLMAHQKCIRVSIMPLNFKHIKICIWKRTRDGGISTGHPTIEQAIDKFVNYDRYGRKIEPDTLTQNK